MGKPRGTARRLLSVLAAGVALTLVVTSCSSSDSDGDKPADGSSASITTEQLVAAFAGAGIATYGEAADNEPEQAVDAPGAVAFTHWQVDNMTRQLNDQRGYLGRDLDELAGTEVPMSVILAAYVSTADTPGAKVARDLMGERDWAGSALDLIYPDAVVALFVNDVAAGDSAASASPASYGGGSVVQPAAAFKAGICTDLSSFLSNTLDSIVTKLQIDATEGVGGVLATIWNTVISIAASAAKLVVEALTAPVLGVIKGAISILAVLSSASSLLDPWTVTMTADNNPVSYGIDPAPGNPVTVTAHVASAVDFQWPADVVDCAAAAGVDLPDPGSAKGSPVTWHWNDPNAVATLGEKDATVDSGGDARLHFTTLTESKSDAEKGELTVSPVGVAADIKRTAVEKLTNLLATVILGQLPAAAADIINGLLGPLKSAAQEKLASLVQASGKLTWVDVHHHGPAKDDETPVPSDSATDCAVVDGVTEVPDGTFEGPISLDVNGKADSSVSVDSSGGGEMTMVVEGGKVVDGSWTLDWSSSGGGNDDGVVVKIDVTGHIGGAVKGSAAAPVAVGQYSVNGKANVTAMGIKQSVPIKESGSTDQDLTIESTSCDDVTATFIPSFNAKTQGVAVISGVARWTASRVE